jgi:hypothetical protein
MYRIRGLALEINKEKFIFVMVSMNQYHLISLNYSNRWCETPMFCGGWEATEQEILKYIGDATNNQVKFLGNRKLTLTKRVSRV